MEELNYLVINERGKVIAAFLRRWQAEQFIIMQASEICELKVKGDEEE